jgi:hypothetical protein
MTDTTDLPIEQLRLSVPAFNLAKIAGLRTVGELADAAPMLTDVFHGRAQRRREREGVGGPTLTYCARAADDARARLREIHAL